jgi:hypothetical protein
MILEKLNEGDVIYTTCAGTPAVCYHLGIVFDNGIKKLIYHNDPSNINKYGGSITAEPYDDFMKGRIINKIIRTNAKNDEIVNVSRKYKTQRWHYMFFNCEDFVLEIVDGEKKSDLRDLYKLIALGTSTLLVL